MSQLTSRYQRFIKKGFHNLCRSKILSKRRDEFLTVSERDKQSIDMRVSRFIQKNYRPPFNKSCNVKNNVRVAQSPPSNTYLVLGINTFIAVTNTTIFVMQFWNTDFSKEILKFHCTLQIRWNKNCQHIADQSRHMNQSETFLFKFNATPMLKLKHI